MKKYKLIYILLLYKFSFFYFKKIYSIYFNYILRIFFYFSFNHKLNLDGSNLFDVSISVYIFYYLKIKKYLVFFSFL